MSYDLNILVLEQESPSKLPFISPIELINELEEKLRYYTWEYMKVVKGIWYYLAVYDPEMEMSWSFPICNSDFDMEDSSKMPCWIKDENIQHVLTPLIIYDEYIVDFKKIIKYMISQSPIKKIMFLARYQWGDKEVICGVLSYSEFISMLENKEILFNVSYIIGE